MDDSSGDDLTLDREQIGRHRFRMPITGVDSETLSQLTILCRGQVATLGRIGTIPITPTAADTTAAETVEVEIIVHRPES